MQTPSAGALLDVWEAGQGLLPAQRALTLCRCLYPEASLAELASLSLGQRDAMLLDLRRQLFGSRIEAQVSCPSCSEQLELAFHTEDVRAGAPVESVCCESGGCCVELRPVTTLDLLALAGLAPARRRGALLQRIVVRAERDGELLQALELPEAALVAAETALAAVDPQAETRIDLDCPACGHVWQAALDIASFLWSELSDWALGLLGEVHVLARTYGWSEEEVLGLSARRRRLYLEMVEG